MDNLVIHKNGNFNQKLKFWSKDQNFRQKSRFFVKNQNLGQKSRQKITSI